MMLMIYTLWCPNSLLLNMAIYSWFYHVFPVIPSMMSFHSYVKVYHRGVFHIFEDHWIILPNRNGKSTVSR